MDAPENANARANAPTPWLAVGLLSSAALAYEVLLARLFSVIYWGLLAHLVISLALLGYGISGTILSLFGHRLERRFPSAFVGNALLFAICAPVSFAAAERIPFNALELSWSPTNWLYFAACELVLSLPFIAAANAIALALWRDGGRLHRVYAADITGAGLGSLFVAGLLFLLPPSQVFRIVVLVGMTSGAVAAWQLRLPRSIVLGIGLLGAITALFVPSAMFQPTPSPFKDLPRALAAAGADVAFERHGPFGSLTVVRSPKTPFRIARGLSASLDREIPPQWGLFRDGDFAGPITLARTEPADFAYLDALPSAVPYHILRANGSTEAAVLILGAGTGELVRQASMFGATRIDVTEHDPALRMLLLRDLTAAMGSPFEEARVHPMAARAFTIATQQRFDLIHLEVTGVDSASLGALSVNFDLTLEAVRLYLNRLTPSGLLSIDLPVEAPPRILPRIVMTAVRGLLAEGFDPASRIIVIRGWRTATLVVSPMAFRDDAIAVVRTFAAERSFDLDRLPQLRREEASLYNVLPGPLLFDLLEGLISGERDDHVARHKFNLEPATDDRPFPFQSVRWATMAEMWPKREAGGGSQLEWGYLILLASLIQAILLSGLLILVPGLIVSPQQRAEVRESSDPSRPLPVSRVVLHFGALGLAFIALELSFVHILERLLMDPVLALSTTLAAFLMSAGIGSRLAPRVNALAQRVVRGTPWPIFVGVGVFVATPLLFFDDCVSLASAWPSGARFLVAFGLVAPLAFLMGMPFPIALARLRTSAPERLPVAWAANGCLSVVGAIGAELSLLALGFTATAALGALLYLCAALLWPFESGDIFSRTS